MAKKNKFRNRKPGLTIPIAVVAGLGAWGYKAYNDRGPDGLNGAARNAMMYLTGFDIWTGNWYGSNMKFGALPIVAGLAAHKVANMFGLNRLLARSGIPLIRI